MIEQSKLVRSNVGNTHSVTIRQVRDYLYISDTSTDALLDLLISDVENAFERFTDRTLITREHTLYVPYICNGMRLRGGPAENVVINYKDEDEVAQVVPDTDYFMEFDFSRPQVVLYSEKTFPTTDGSQCNIVYDAGMSTDADDIAPSIKGLLLDMIAYRFENRGTQDLKWPDEIIRGLNSHRLDHF